MHLGSSIRQLPLRALLTSSVLLSTALFCTASSHSAQGESGYLRGRGGLVVALSHSSSTFEEEITTGNFSDVDRATMGLYVNYGLRDDLDVIVQPLFSSADSKDGALGDGEEALTDISLAFKWRAMKREIGPGELHLLLAPGMQTPLSNYANEGTFSLGSGHTDYNARGIAHFQSRLGNWWTSVEGGYDFRTGPTRDVLVIRAQIGLNFGFFVLQPFYDDFDARGGSDDPSAGGNLQSAGIDYSQYGLKAYVPINPHLGLSLSSYWMDDGRSTGTTSGLSFGVVYIH